MENQNKMGTQTNQTKKNYFSLYALVLAIYSFLMNIIFPPVLYTAGPYVLTLLLLSVIILGILGLKKSKELNKGKEMAIAGIILAILIFIMYKLWYFWLHDIFHILS